MSRSCEPFIDLASSAEDRRQLLITIVAIQASLVVFSAALIEVFTWISEVLIGTPLFGPHPWKVGVIVSFFPLLLDTLSYLKISIHRRFTDASIWRLDGDA